ncbi:hypothetical protein AMK22_32155 [Streptomyces sp. CB01580]|nr:hypothetical protein AMK22_32155 [Streptomyces sp. CB01580]
MEEGLLPRSDQLTRLLPAPFLAPTAPAQDLTRAAAGGQAVVVPGVIAYQVEVDIQVRVVRFWFQNGFVG